jgi:hypothetical protein
MSSAVLRALARRVDLAEDTEDAPGRAVPGPLALPRQDIYLHAVATGGGLRLDEHLSELTERPPLGRVLNAGREAAAMRQLPA